MGVLNQAEIAAAGGLIKSSSGSLLGPLSNPLLSSGNPLWESMSGFSLAKDRADDAQLELFEQIAYPPLYFDPTAADDTGDGSLGRPYKNLTAARLVAGRRHLIKAGTTITTGAGDPWLSIPATGTAQQPIILGRYGPKNLADPIIDGSAATKVIRGAAGSKYWRVRDIEIIGGKSGSIRFAVSQNFVDANATALTTTAIVLARLKIHDVTSDGANDCDGIKLYGADNVILDCEIYDIATDAIWFHGYRMKISGNKIYRVAQDGLAAGDCIQCGAKSDGSVIRGNYLDHFEVDIKQCIYFEPTISISDNVLIEDNYCVIADGNTNGTAAIRCGATNSIVRRNFAKGGQVSISIGPGGIAYNNIVVSTVGRGIACSSNAQIYYNTVVQTGSETSQTNSAGIAASSPQAGVLVRNNLLIGQYNGILGSLVDGTPNIVESNNGFAIRGVSDAKFRMEGVVTPPTDPVSDTYANAFVNLVDTSYRPIPSSPLLTGGISISATDGQNKDQIMKNLTTIGAY